MFKMLKKVRTLIKI